jgi:hypothetical protein
MKTQEKISNEKGNWYIVEIIEKCEPVDRNEKQDLKEGNDLGKSSFDKS